MVTVLLAIHVIVAVMIVVSVLLQSGKGGGLGGGLGGGGGSNTLFGSSQGGNFFTKLTTGLALVFALTSLSLTVIKGKQDKQSIFDNAPISAPAGNAATPVTPAAPAAAASSSAAPAAAQATNTAAPAEKK